MFMFAGKVKYATDRYNIGGMVSYNFDWLIKK